MLEAVFTERVIKPFDGPGVKTCEAIAAAMAESGEIWLPLLQFDAQHGANIERLIAAGMLRKDGRLVGFQHQTMFDYVRVRAFCSGAESLSSYVLKHQAALFVRPTLWAAANSMRSLARGLYHREVGSLWRDPALRKHVRFLLISFLGRVADPDEEETQWLLPAIDNSLRDKALVSMIGSPGWFAKLRSRLPTLMGSDDPQLSWELSIILRAALEFDRNGALDLIRRYWADTKRDGYVLNVFREVKNWDPSSIGIVKSIVGRSKPDPFYIKQACESMALVYPELATDLLVTRLNADLADAGGSPERVLLSHDWHGIEKLGIQASWPLLYRLWAWLRDALDRSPKRVARDVVGYRREDSWELDDGIGHPGLMQLFGTLLDKCASENPERFKEFLAVEAGTDLMLLHRLLSQGLRRLASSSPEVVLGYLTGDPRRLSIGSCFSSVGSCGSGPHSVTEALISAVVPHLGRSGATELERYIMGWHYYRDFSQGDPEFRLRLRKDDRRHQLQLLAAFPLDRLSAAGRRLRQEKGIALPTLPDSDGGDRPGIIGSPMSTESMQKASKESILGLFSELQDATGDTHPRDWMRGGAVQAAQAFGKLAEKQPQKVIEILREFKAGQQELPAAEAIVGLSKVPDLAPQLVLELVQKLDRAGFRSSEFRRRVSWALTDLSDRGKGLPDETCELLESWIEPVRRCAIDPAATAASESGGWFNKAEDAGAKKRAERPMSMLWGHGMLGFFAQGNYSILRALTYGFLNRDKPDTERWMALLERHLTRRENPDVWTSLLLDLRNLCMVTDRTRAANFTRDLMCRQPSAFRSVEGLIFLAWNHRFLPPDVNERCLRIWRARNWKGRDQAIGEFSLLRSVQAPDDRIWSRIVDGALSAKGNASRTSDLRLGIAYAATNLWSDPALKRACHNVILRLLPLANDDLAGALMDIFRVGHPMPPDRFTVELLNRVIAEPKMLACDSMFAHRLNELLADGLDPLLVACATNAMLNVSGQAVGDLRSRWAADSRYLVQIAMTLQKIDVSRDAGLDLFERLMDLGAYEVDTVLREVDRKIM